MTDEQIKQNADAFAMKVAESHIIEKRPAYVAAFNTFMAGAHSRDEEVNQLENALRNVNEYCHKLRNKVYELRNQWISVEDRLPKKGECVFVRYGDVAHPLYSSAYMIEKELWSIERYGNGEVAHWMPIPPLHPCGGIVPKPKVELNVNTDEFGMTTKKCMQMLEDFKSQS